MTGSGVQDCSADSWRLLGLTLLLNVLLMIRKKIAKMLFLGIIHFRLISKNGGGSDLVIIFFASIAVNGAVIIGNRARSYIQKHVRCVEEKGHLTNLSRNKTTVAKIHIQY